MGLGQRGGLRPRPGGLRCEQGRIVNRRWLGHHGAMNPPPRVSLSDFPQLSAIAWHCRGVEDLAEDEAFALYEAHWRHLDPSQLDDRERALIERLIQEYGGGLLNV